MTNKFLDRLTSKGILVSDGAAGTNLQNLGLIAGVSPETWVMEQPQKIIDLEKAFVEAGSDIILTCTFGGTSLRLKDSLYHDQVNGIKYQSCGIGKGSCLEPP